MKHGKLQKAGKRNTAGFTLIELLVVIAIIAVLAVVVIISLNPAELLAQARDSTRISNLSTVDGAINDTRIDNLSLGAANTLYISVPDPSATSTAGDQCQGLGLPALQSGWSYHCAVSSTYLAVNGTGWIPIPLANSAMGSPLSVLPTDPINTTSTGLYYTYQTDGQSWMLTAIPESQKQKTASQTNPNIPGYPGVLAQGSNLGLSPIFDYNSGMVGWWQFNEGSGTTTYDLSGDGNNGTLSATGVTWTTGKAGGALQFNGSTGYVNAGTNASLNLMGSFAVAAWVEPLANGPWHGTVAAKNMNSGYGLRCQNYGSSGSFYASWSSAGAWETPSTASGACQNGSWSQIVVTGAFGSSTSIYINGKSSGTATIGSSPTYSSATFLMGGGNGYNFNGLLSDVRVYNRALSAAEITALYNSEK